MFLLFGWLSVTWPSVLWMIWFVTRVSVTDFPFWNWWMWRQGRRNCSISQWVTIGHSQCHTQCPRPKGKFWCQPGNRDGLAAKQHRVRFENKSGLLHCAWAGSLSLVLRWGPKIHALSVAGQVSMQPHEQHRSTTGADWKDVNMMWHWRISKLALLPRFSLKCH